MNNALNDKPNKIIKLVSLISFFALILSSYSCFNEEPPITPGIKETTVFIASDLHLFSNNLISPDNKIYVKENFTSDGRIQEYDYELVNELIEEVNLEKPDYLILTGDLSFNGEKDSHLELANLLNKIETTKTLVIPGNHDLFSANCVSVLGDKSQKTKSLGWNEFREIYSSFGYKDAYSYDDNSLSYIYKLSEDKWAIMLDTTQSKYNEVYGYNIVGGYVEEPTMTWLENNLKYAKENNISVISFTHHNLLVHNELFKSRYTITNYEEVLALYSRYNVNLNFSGHLHIQSIKNTRVNGLNIYDISSNSLLDYGNRYGKLDIYDNCYSYESKMLTYEEELKDLQNYSFNVFCDKYYQKTLKQYQSTLGEENGKLATKLLSEINSYYFDGSYEIIHSLINDNKQIYNLIKQNTSNYDKSYVKSIMDVPNKNQHDLIVKRVTN